MPRWSALPHFPLLINGETITQKEEILSQFTNHLKNKYNDLSGVIDNDEYLKQNVTRKLNTLQKRKLDEPLSLSELSSALASMKKGRSPGSNGFTSDFFKIFWDYLGIFLFRTAEESINNGTLPLSHRESIVTLIPKAGKPLNSLKDWRPISLLNVDFKIISSAITNRLKTVIQDIISPSQSAYIKGRFIGENSRLVYDIVDDLNSKNRSGLILAADFEAAFESVSWSFLSQALNYYNFGPYYKYLLNLLYLNSNNFSRILLDGFLGEKIHMRRGIRQGDPASGYLFNLVVEPLANQIMQSTIIRGINVSHDNEIRLSQYADDLIVFLNDQSGSIDGAIHEIQIFTSMSGLKINTNKTKCLPIGKKSNTLQMNSHGIQYVEELKILGITFNRNNENLATINTIKILSSVEKEVLQWNRRHLTLIGKITVVKALLLSKLVHIFIALPNPPKNVIEKIETILFRFIWNNKNDRVKRTKIIQRQELDGLNMIYLYGFIKSMKISWMERLYKSGNPWRSIAQQNIPSLEDLRTYGSRKLKSIQNTIQNLFWKDVIEAWTEFFELYKPNSQQIITEKLWFSDVSKFKKSIIKSWDTKGIRYVADLINNSTGILYSKSEIEQKYNVKMTFLCYSSLIRSLPDTVKTTNYKSKITHPIMPYRISLMYGSTKMSRLAYTKFQLSVKSHHKKAQFKLEHKWIRDINHHRIGSTHDISEVTKNTYLQTFHFRLISRIIPTKYFLNKIGRAESNLCTFCAEFVETLSHLFWDCEHTKLFITEIKQQLTNRFNITYNITKNAWFFPNLKECSELEIMISTVGKVTIYKAQIRNIPLSVNYFFNYIQMEIENDLYIARGNDKIDKFRRKWGRLETIITSNDSPRLSQNRQHPERRSLSGARAPLANV